MTTTVSACPGCGDKILATLDNGKILLCYNTKCELYGKEQALKTTPTHSPTETVSDCQHNWKKTFCGDGCKEHPGVWEVCLNCNDKRRIV